MSNFWPSGLAVNDTEPPMDILQYAKQEWDASSSNTLTLVFQTGESETGNDMIIVHAQHLPSKRTATLFSVVHRKDLPYPATIQPKKDDLPTFLKKTYYKPGFADLGIAARSTITDVTGKTITNKWVADTPSEFRDRLAEAFNLSTVKSDVVSLLAGAKEPDDDEAAEGPSQNAPDEAG